MRLLAVAEKDNGCDYHRCIVPTAFMECEKKLITNDLTEERVAEGWDIVMYNRAVYDVPIEIIQQWKAKYGFTLVVDTDDYWKLDPHHILYDDFNSGWGETIFRNLAAADLVTTTHERLAGELRKYFKNVAVLPNSLPYGWQQFNDEKIESDKVRLGWCGSITHQRDIEILRNPLKRVAELKGLQMYIGGYNDSNEESKRVWEAIVHSLSVGLKLWPIIGRARDVFSYMDMYKQIDIMLIPLLDTPFNRMKSNLKVLEAAAKKIPVIVSKVDPYLDLPHVCYVETQQDWYKHIKRLVNDPEERKERGEKLYQWCKEYYDISKVNETRCNLLTNNILKTTISTGNSSEMRA